ncbi:hypothetical protein Hanom_Chr00s026466g01765981 [Helianthus anomalus]
MLYIYIYTHIYIYMSKLQVLSFMFTSNFRRCPLGQNLTGGVLYVSKSCMFCSLDQTQLEFSVKICHVQRHIRVKWSFPLTPFNSPSISE